ncbi:hypothetical protein YC2023_084741 [Brassica napus]
MIGLVGVQRPNERDVKSAVAGARTRDGGHLSRDSYTTRPREPKRLVQGFVSPRNKAMAKQASKGVGKGPAPTKKASVKPKSDQD